jgi:hypothetical protein
MRPWILAALLVAVVLALAIGAIIFAPAVGSTAGGGGHIVPTSMRLDAAEAALLAQSAPANQPLVAGWGNLMTEDFEGTFPGSKWRLPGNPTWGKVTYRKHAGTYSAYAVGGGSAKVTPPGPYPPKTTTWMISGPYNLAAASDAELAFYHWTKTEYTSDFKSDDLNVLASIDGQNFSGVRYSGDFTQQPGNVQGWLPEVLDLTDVPPLGNLAGKPAVWIAFTFVSDATTQDEGTYVDDVALRVYTGPTPSPTVTPTPAPSCPGASKSSYLTTDDNENNALSGQPDNDMYSTENQLCFYRSDAKTPIEFRIIANNPPGLIHKAQLNLRVYDVDEQDPTCAEVDTVLFNHTNAGKLTGADMQWSTTALDLSPSLVQAGSNLVQVQINTLNCPNPLDPANPQGRWCTSVDWGELVLEGGQGAASIRSAATNAACYVPGGAVHLQVEVDSTLASQEVRTEVNILDANDINLVGQTQIKTLHSNQNDAFSFDLQLPAGAATNNYRAQIIVTDKCSETQNAYRELAVRIDPACGTPTSTPTPTRTLTPTPTLTPTASATSPAARPLFMPLIVRSA